MQTNSTVAFTLPAGASSAGVYAYRITSPPTGASTVWRLLNTPGIWFLHADEGEQATPGGWIGVYGTSMLSGVLNPSYPPALVLTNNATQSWVRLQPSASRVGDRWVQYFDVPASVPPGEYEVWMHSGAGGPFGWSKYSTPITSYTLTTITIAPASSSAIWSNISSAPLDLSRIAGASPDAQLSTAMTTLTKAGGGVLYIPAGTYYLNKSISIPPRTIVRGAGKGQTTLVFRMVSRPGNLFTGTSFGIESLTVRAPMSGADCNLLSTATSWGCTYTAIQKKRNTDFSWVKDVDILKPAADDLPPANWNVSAYVTLCTNAINTEASENLGIDNVFAEDCYNFVTVTGQSNYTRATNCRFAYRDMSFLFRCGHNLVIENGARHFLGTARINNRYINGWQPGFLVGEYCPTSFTKHIYYANMTSTSENHSWNDNTNADGKEGWYYGGVDSVNGKVMRLSDILLEPVYHGTTQNLTKTYDMSLLEGSIVGVVGGRGIGQTRVLAKAVYDPESPTVTLDAPWDVNPDNTSTIAITKFKGRMLFVRNNFTSEGLHQVSWAAAAEVIYADNWWGANFVDASNGTGPKIVGTLAFLEGGLNDSAVAPTQVGYTSLFRFGTPGVFAGMLSGNWYGQVLNNSAIPNTWGVDIWSTSGGTPAADSNTSWSGQVSFGLVFRGNKNPGRGHFTINTGMYSGTSIVEGNTNVDRITTSIWPGVTSNRILFRANTQNNASVPLYLCLSRINYPAYCGASPSNLTLDCNKKCANNGSLALFLP